MSGFEDAVNEKWRARIAELERHRAELQELCTAQITKIRELDEAVHQRNDRIEYIKGEAERMAHEAAKDYVDMCRFQALYIAAVQRLRSMELAQAEVDKAFKSRVDGLELENASLRSRIALLELEAIDPEGRR
jgi:chromosome segregation ATPase